MRTKRMAFTLVELLIVIGVIAVLIAMLMPVLSVAREQARRVEDLNRIRMLTVGCLAYAADNDRYLPQGRRYNCYDTEPPGSGFDHYRQWVRNTVWHTLRDRYGLPDECGSCIHVDMTPVDVDQYVASVVPNVDVWWGWIYWGGRQDILPYNGSKGYISPQRTDGPKTSDTLITCMVEDCSTVEWASSAPHVHGMHTVLAYNGYTRFSPKPEWIGVGYTDGSAAFVPFESMTPIVEYHTYPQGTLFYHKR